MLQFVLEVFQICASILRSCSRHSDCTYEAVEDSLPRQGHLGNEGQEMVKEIKEAACIDPGEVDVPLECRSGPRIRGGVGGTLRGSEEILDCRCPALYDAMVQDLCYPAALHKFKLISRFMQGFIPCIM